MQCQILFSGKNKKNISKCRLLKILPRVLSVNSGVVLILKGLNSGILLYQLMHLKSTGRMGNSVVTNQPE